MEKKEQNHHNPTASGKRLEKLLVKLNLFRF
jgi:hypothetical protein